MRYEISHVLAMIVCIEYWEGDTYLIGKKVSLQELKSQIQSVEIRYDPDEDNFVPMLCRMYGWEVTEECIPDCIYDRDTSLYL